MKDAITTSQLLDPVEFSKWIWSEISSYVNSGSGSIGRGDGINWIADHIKAEMSY
jgi:hypothetical protein